MSVQIPQIRLQQTYAQIGLRITQPIQELQQPPADLSIEQIPSRMNIQRQPSRLEIDQEQAWNELGMKSLSVLSSDSAEFSKQEGLRAVAEIAQKGDRMAAIHIKSNAFVELAVDTANPRPADFNIAFIPSHGSVKINYVPTEMHIDWQQGGTKIESTPHMPVHHYTPGKTEVYLQQKQSLQIDFVGVNVNEKI